MSLTNQKYLFLILALFLTVSATAQSSQEPFGKNRIQYKNFRWKFITTAHFEIYYYNDSDELAIKAASYAEDDFNRITEITGFTPPDKIKIILYNSVSDMQQSNIGLADQELMIGGQTILVKSKSEVAFSGSQLKLMEDISYGVARVIVENIMYGGNVKDVVKSSYLMSLPEWFISGAAAYIAKDWSDDMDDFMRDKTVHDQLKNPSSYSGEEAVIIGHSIWNYIAKEYSENDVSNIINLTRAFRDEKESIESNLGVSYEDFVLNWKEYYRAMQAHLLSTYVQTDDSTIKVNARRSMKFTSLKINSEGNRIAYAQNNKGKYKIRLFNTETKKIRTLLSGGFKSVEQVTDYTLPVIAWQNETMLTSVIRRRDKLYLKSFDLKNRKQYKKPLAMFRQVQNMSFSPDGNQIVFSADKNGQSDIFLYTPSSGSLVQITNDSYDDFDPVFSENKIIFSSNRQNDTLNRYRELPQYHDNYFLYQWNPSNGNNLERFTRHYNNKSPLLPGNGLLYFLSDEKGISNIFRLSPDTGKVSQVTNQITDIKNFGYSSKSGVIAFISTKAGIDRLCLINHPPARKLNTPNTVRKNMIRAHSAEETGMTDDSVNFNFNSNEESGFDNLIFESELKKDSQIVKEPEAPVSASEKLRYTGPFKYRNPFGADKVISTLMVDPLRGLGALLEGGMSDLLGNHRIDAGGFIAFDFRSSKLFGEYRYVKGRTDYKIRYDRQVLNPESDFDSHRYILNLFGITTSYPLSIYHRVSLTPFVAHTTFRENTITNYTALARKDITALYGALRGEFVYDNTLVTGMNMLKGTRFKMSAEYYLSDSSRQRDFGLLFLDFRKYFPIHRELVLATRISYGHYFGNAPKNFLIGGMDNWLLSNREFYSSANSVLNSNPLTIDRGVDNSDLLFVRYVTSLRGFRYNSQFGPKYLLFNAELRLPVVRYFYRGTISSNFLRNLQLIGFTDIGTAYKGTSPFTTDNTQNQQAIPGYPFTANVTNYRSPFLVGYGWGVRTMLLGYYVKFDMAWGVQNSNHLKPQIYLTFGYDF